MVRLLGKIFESQNVALDSDAQKFAHCFFMCCFVVRRKSCRQMYFFIARLDVHEQI